MIVGTLRLRLLIRDAHSLKEKRRMLRSLKEHLSRKFNISVAETDHQDVWQTAEIGIATVGTDTPFVHSVLSNVTTFVKTFHGVVVTDEELETYSE